MKRTQSQIAFILFCVLTVFLVGCGSRPQETQTIPPPPEIIPKTTVQPDWQSAETPAATTSPAAKKPSKPANKNPKKK